MKVKILAVTVLAAGILAACGGNNNSNTSQEKETIDIKELVQGYSSGSLKAESASITSEQLMVKDAEGKEQLYNLSGDEFFVSIAPYVNQTHP